MDEFRLVVNKSVRLAMALDIRSRFRLSNAAYRSFSLEHRIQRSYLVSAFQEAMGVLKAHRRRIRKGKPSSLPIVRRPFLKVPAQTVQLDRQTGRLRVPTQNGEAAVVVNLGLSAWHRSLLGNTDWAIAGLTIVPGRVIIALKKSPPPQFKPEAVLALDSNEESMDGVFAERTKGTPTSIPLNGCRQLQLTHFRRRRRLSKKKSGDRRILRRLLKREGRRERHRVGQRLHLISKRLIQAAAARRSAIALEELKGFRRAGNKRINRRLSSWPFHELHRQIEYKAALAGVPVIKVNPWNTSRSCPACGDVQRRVRVGRMFECRSCDWRIDRQINAGLNILKSALALSKDEAWARGLWFDPGALRKDMVTFFCGPSGAARGESSGAGVTWAG